MGSIDEAKRDAAMSSDLFADRLRWFVKRWSPSGRDAHDFQMDLTRIMVDAMRHKTTMLNLGIETYASQVYNELAMRPLAAIVEPDIKKS